MMNRQTKKFSKRRTIPIPSIELSNEFLKELYGIIDEEYKKIKSQDKYSKLTITVQEKNKDIYTFYDVKSFLDEVNLKNFKAIETWLYGGGDDDEDLRLTMNTNIMYNQSEYTVTGTNLNWVRDIKEHIKEVFEKYGTKKDFFHSRKSWIVWILLGFSLALLYRYYLPSDTISETIQVSIWTPTLSFYLWLLFAWLFPRIETKYMLQTKVRKWVLIGLLGIPFSVLGNYIWSLFQR